MTDLRQAAEQALEALLHAEECVVLGEGGHLMLLNIYAPEHISEAITALRAALAEPMGDRLGSEWVPCVKLPVTVHVREQRLGETHVSTREGITPVKPDDLIMRGVSGEEYPIGREIFERTYKFSAALADQPQSTHWEGCEKVHPECAAAKQAGCPHCRHPLYAGIRCSVCGRWSEHASAD